MTVVVSLGVTVVSLVTPVLIQKVFDHGLDPFDASYTYTICGIGFVLVIIAFVAARIAGRRLVVAAENAMMQLRVHTFSHIHALSIADQSEEKRGVFVARVTADIDALQQFMEWGGIAWIISLTQVIGALGLMLFYAWQLALAICILIVPLLLIVWSMQAKLTVAFNTARTRVGEMLSEVSESVMGAAVVRAYGLDEHTDQKVKRAIDQRYRAEVMAHFRAATLWPLSSVFYALSLSTVVVLGAFYGPRWGMSFGQVTAFLFLADVFLHVFTDLPEVYSETQNAIAAWRKILAVNDMPIEIVEPVDGVELPRGALVGPGRRRPLRLPGGAGGAARDLAVRRPRAATSRSSARRAAARRTFAKLLSRLADPTDGTMSDRRGRPPEGRARLAACRDPHGAAGRVPVRHDRARERPVWDARARATATSRPRSRSSGSAIGWRRCPRGSRRQSASAARPCRSASASWSRWCGRSSATRGC